MQFPPITKPSNGLTSHPLKEGPGDEEKRGHQSKGHNRDQDSSGSPITSPLPALSSVQIQTPTGTPSPVQPKGLNGRDVLKEMLDNGQGNRPQQPPGHEREQVSSGSGLTSPLPTLPGVQLSTNPTLTSTPPVGLTSAPVLKDALDDGKSGGTHHTGGMERGSSTPVMTSPLPTLPAVEVPTNSTMAPSQAGGFNSHHLLKDVFDHARGGGKEKHQGGDRHH
jgi:hypothetical protein